VGQGQGHCLQIQALVGDVVLRVHGVVPGGWVGV
jgi:hypothetical protein